MNTTNFTYYCLEQTLDLNDPTVEAKVKAKSTEN